MHSVPNEQVPAEVERALARVAARVGLNDIERRVLGLALAGVERDAIAGRLGEDPRLIAAAARAACARLEIESLAELRRVIAAELDRGLAAPRDRT